MTTRQERDILDPINVPAERLWGAQTQRSLHHLYREDVAGSGAGAGRNDGILPYVLRELTAS